MQLRRTVPLFFSNGPVFLRSYFNHGGMGGVVVPPITRLSIGDEVNLDLTLDAENIVFHTLGVARWHRTIPEFGFPPGTGVEFLPSEQQTRDLLLETANAKTVRLSDRQSPRYTATMNVEYTTDSVLMTDVTDDISQDGALVRTDHPLNIGEHLQLNLLPPGARSGIEVDAEVVRLHRGEKNGVGVRFVHIAPDSRLRLDQLLDRLKQQEPKSL